MAIESLLTLLVALLASLFMAWVIGAGSSGATPFAPAVGANAISIMRAAFVVGLFGFAGAALQGANVSETIGRGLVQGVTLDPLAVVLVLGLGGGLMAVGILTGYPIAAAFTVTGAVVGIGLGLGGSPAWGAYLEIVTLWLLIPVVGGGTAYGLASLLPRDDLPEHISVPVLGAFVAMVVANIEFAVLGAPGVSQSLAELGAGSLDGGVPVRVALSLLFGVAVALVLGWRVARNQPRALRRFLVVLGALVAFSAGASQVGLAVGPLLPLFDQFQIRPVFALVGGGLGILVGSWTAAPRMIKSLARDYSTLGPRRSISALVPAFLIAQLAVFLGIPVSFNEIIVSGIVGSGLAVGGAGVSRQKILYTLAAWAGSLVLALVVGYGSIHAVTLVGVSP